MKLLIVDDEPLARQELAYIIKQYQSESEIFEANNIKTAQAFLLKERVQVVFLDMHLQNERGLELMATINAMATPPLVVFATAYDNYAIKAFDMNAADYILKPFEDERIQLVLHRLEKLLANHQIAETAFKTKTTSETASETTAGTASEAKTRKVIHKFLPIEVDERIVMVPLQDIQVIATEDGALMIYTADQAYPMRDTLKMVKNKLPDEAFMQVHRAFIVNVEQIAEIQPWFNRNYQLTMTNQHKVIVSRSYMNEFKTRMGIE